MTAKKRSIRVIVKDRVVQIPVDESVFAYFNEQFVFPKPSAKQKKKLRTLMNIVRAAYQEGYSDGERDLNK